MADASVIGQGTVVRGNVRGDGSLEVYGRIEGDVDVGGDVTLGESAVVRGSVTGARLVIGGSVLGDVTGTEGLQLGRAAQVKGDLAAPLIGIEEGAQVRGSIRTGHEPSVPAGLTARAEPSRTVRERPAERPTPAPALPKRTPAAAPAEKKRPPAPVVPAIRRGQGKKKKARRH